MRRLTALAAGTEPFDNLAHEWWNEQGPFRPLHRMNIARLTFIQQTLHAFFSSQHHSQKTTLLDVGCGGGLLCEPLARLGLQVTGIDASSSAIQAAQTHAKLSELKINYLNTLSSVLVKQRKQYDIVTALELIEHVDDPLALVKDCAALVKKDGLVFLSTLNRNPKSFLLGIAAAEYLLRWVPAGTHEWKKFIRPSELQVMLEKNGLKLLDMAGIVLNPATRNFELSPQNVDVNYIAAAIKT